MGIYEKFKVGYKKSADNIASGLRAIIIKKEIDDKTLDEIEEFLISSDVGIDASSEIKEIIARKKIDPKKDLSTEINLILKEYIKITLESEGKDPETFYDKNNFDTKKGGQGKKIVVLM